MRLPGSQRLLLKVGVLLLAWIAVAALATIDSLDFSDDLEIDSSPYVVLQQALEPDLDDIRQLCASLGSAIPSSGLKLLGQTDDQEALPTSFQVGWIDPSDSPLYQRLSTYRI
jgi:hypothetical protein